MTILYMAITKSQPALKYGGKYLEILASPDLNCFELI